MNRLLTTICLALLIAACGASPDQPPVGNQPPVEPPPDPVPSAPAPEHTIAWSEWAPDPSQTITIPAGETVLLDVNPAPLGDLIIDGNLVFNRQDLQLTAASIMVHGSLYIGQSDAPFTHRAVITLTGERSADTEQGMGDRYLAAMGGGRLELHGPKLHSWTLLARDAQAGDSSITVLDASGWQVGDRIVVATTDYPTWNGAALEVQTEQRTVTGIDGATLELDEPLGYFHVGEIMTVDGVKVDQRAEVARLSRNIVIQGPEGTLDEASPDYAFGGHVMVMSGGSAYITGVEFRRMGQRGILARYPMHFHFVRDGGAGSYVRHSAVHDSFNRCLTIHGTNHVLVSDVVGFGAPGHCFFLEDGAEMENTLHGNLALSPRVPDDGFAILPSDNHPYFGPAGFWITNPANDLIGNRAVASPGIGIWYAFPPEPTGEYLERFGDAGIRPRSTPLGVFRDNVVHSNHSTGLHVDNGFGQDLEVEGATYYAPRTDPLDMESEPVLAAFENLIGWRNRDGAAWFRGEHTVLSGGLLSDNPIGVTFASTTSWAEDLVFVGETPNPGTPDRWEETGPNGESLPRPWDPDFAIRGFEFYDGDVAVRDSHFVAYRPNSVRDAAALGYKDYTAFDVSPLNSSSGLTFAGGSKRVQLESRSANQDGHPADGYRSAIFIDEDGSVTGAAGTVVTMNNPFLLTPDCELHEDWNARLCPAGTGFAALNLHAVGGGHRPFGDVTVMREDGTSHLIVGTPGSARYRTILLLDDSYTLDYSGQVNHLRVNLSEVGPTDSLLVSLPYTGGVPFIYQDWWIDERSLVAEFTSLAELRASEVSGFHHDGARLHLKLVQDGDRDYAQLDVCSAELCGW